MRRVVAVLVLVLLAFVAWWLRPSESEHAPVPVKSNAAEVPPPPEVPRVRPPRVRGETPSPTPDAETKADAVTQPTADPAPTKYPVTVTVLRSDGTPAKGAAVLLVGPDDDGNPSAAGNTDADGRLVLRADEDPVRVVAWLDAEAGAPQELISPKDEISVTVRLGPSVVVRGRVLMDGKPVWEAYVTVTAQPWFKSDFGLVLTARTNAGGEFVTSPIPEAGIDLLKPPYVEARTHNLATGYAETDLDVVRRGGEVVVELKRAFTVIARFVDSRGARVRDVMLRWAGGERSSQSRQNGEVVIMIPGDETAILVALRPTPFKVSARADGTGRERWWTAMPLGTFDHSSGEVDLGNVVVAPGAPLKGVVVDGVGRPSPHAFVMLSMDGVPVGAVSADNAGAFVLPEVGLDPHRISVRERLPESSPGVARTAIVDGVKGGDPDLRVVLDDVLAIVLRFLSATDRKPLACSNYSVRVKLHGEGFDWFGTQTAGGGDESHEFTVFQPGSYDVEVDVAGYEPVRFESVEVVAGRETSLDLLLRKKPD